MNKDELYIKFGIKNDYILSVCNLQPRKNLVRLIQAYRKYREESGCQEQLVIVGKKAWMFNDILKEALDGASDIVFTDYVDNTDLVRLYNAAKLFVYPSFLKDLAFHLLKQWPVAHQLLLLMLHHFRKL